MESRIHHCWEIGDVWWDYAEMPDGSFHLRGAQGKYNSISSLHPYYMGVYTAKMESSRLMAEHWPEYAAETSKFYSSI